MKKSIILLAILFLALNNYAQIGDMLKRKAGEGATNATERDIDKGINNIFKKEG